MRIILAAFLFVASLVKAQETAGNPTGQVSRSIKIDTVGYGYLAMPPADSNLVSFELTIGFHSWRVNGKNLPADALDLLLHLPSGREVYYDNIRKRSPGGGTTRMQNHLYVVIYNDIIGDPNTLAKITHLDTVQQGYYVLLDSTIISAEISIRGINGIFTNYNFANDRYDYQTFYRIAHLEKGAVVFYEGIVMFTEGRIYHLQSMGYVIGEKNTITGTARLE